MYDYVDGKVDWMAYGLPVEGKDGPFLGSQLSEVATCDVTVTVGDVRRLLDGSTTDTIVVLAAGDLAVGEVDAGHLEGHDDGDSLLDAMDPVPTTVRPSVTVAALAEGGGGARLVTTSGGRLLGLAAVEAVVHDHDHDHPDGDHPDGDDPDGDHQEDGGADAYEQELSRVMAAIEERFGDEEPSEAELRAFLHDRLVAEGRSVQDADRFLDELDAGGGH